MNIKFYQHTGCVLAYLSLSDSNEGRSAFMKKGAQNSVLGELPAKSQWLSESAHLSRFHGAHVITSEFHGWFRMLALGVTALLQVDIFFLN